MSVTVTPTAIPEMLLLEPTVFGDTRGFFFESFNERDFRAATGVDLPFVQDNHAGSQRGVLRGMHFQRPPMAQGKLVRVSVGEVFDVAVDIRPASPTFGRWVGVTLSAANRRQLWIPPGLAHGYLVTSDVAEFQYKATAYYSPGDEGVLAWDDPSVGIEWPLDAPPTLAARDAAGLALHALR
ncbi:MAG: dTDP-4-dehydrorhamnose 3,5-epimerase [Gemmatimonadota bacterium]